ncbi:hypothetical protein U9M48_044902 [Paspalum notatum var. saurae]|uniref:Uncharacterized protein n=1 Tax=Paspalum notatum var. saurae TaxID=547442 RepID=A0AAQ3V087_PASNO
MVSRIFFHLKYMNINLSGGAFSPHHDCFFAASFLQAAPSLETLILRVFQVTGAHGEGDRRRRPRPAGGDELIASGSPATFQKSKIQKSVMCKNPPRQMEGTPHNNLKIVEIAGFYAAKSLIELTGYILESVTSLDYLTLDTTWGLSRRCSDHTLVRCPPWMSDMIRDSQDAFVAVGAYIEGKVTQVRTEHDPFVEGSSPPRQMEGTPHNNLKIVEIAGFYAAKSLIELTCYILESATSLDCLTLDTTWGLSHRCSDHTLGRCSMDE